MDKVYRQRQDRYSKLHGSSQLDRILNAPGVIRAEELGKDLGFTRQYAHQLYYHLTGEKWGYTARNRNVQPSLANPSQRS